GCEWWVPPLLFLNLVHSLFGLRDPLASDRGSFSFLSMDALSSRAFSHWMASLTTVSRSSRSGFTLCMTMSPRRFPFSPFQNLRTTCRSFISLNFWARFSSSLAYSSTLFLPWTVSSHFLLNNSIVLLGKQ